MIALYRKKPRLLSAQISETEQQILKHQQGVSIRTTKLVREVHQQMTAPATLVLAGGIGFILAEITRGQSSKSSGTADNSSAAETSPLKVALKILVSAHTLYTALPLAWIIKFFHNNDATSGQAPQRKSRPLAASATRIRQQPKR
jgi:hypothetical protein